MTDGTHDPAHGQETPAVQTAQPGTMLTDGAHDPASAPAPSGKPTGPAAGKRTAVLLTVGGAVGMTLGVLLTMGLTTTYTFVTHTVPSTRDSVEVFNQLNELRQQINEMNEEKKLKEQEKEEAVRQALSAVASTVRRPESGTSTAVPPTAVPPGMKEGEKPVARRAERPRDGFADIDEEIERLEQTQKTLNTILDLFTRKAKDGAKDH
jgi:hypothetical protein